MGRRDWVELSRVITKYRPKRILDLGTGIGGSTACMARASRGKAFIDTVEQLEKCIRIARELIPAKYLSHISFHHSEVEIVEFPEIPYRHFIRYQNLPQGDWDLVVIDGPWLKFEKDKLIDLPAADIFALLPQLKEGCLIYLDGRLELKSVIKRFYHSYLEVEEEEEEEDRFTIWKRNTKPFSGLDDALLEKMKTFGYFDEG